MKERKLENYFLKIKNKGAGSDSQNYPSPSLVGAEDWLVFYFFVEINRSFKKAEFLFNHGGHIGKIHWKKIIKGSQDQDVKFHGRD